MDNNNIKKRSVMEFAEFSKAYDNAHKAVMLKDGNKAHPGARDIKGEVLYVRNDANPYRAMGIPFDEKLADVNPKYMNANQVDVFHGRKLTSEEKKIVNDAYGNQVVTPHQMAFILDESISNDVKFGVMEAEFKIDEIDKKIEKLNEEEYFDENFYFGIRAMLYAYDEGLSKEVEAFFDKYGVNNGQDTDAVVDDAEGKISTDDIIRFASEHRGKSSTLDSFLDELNEGEDSEKDDEPKELTDADYKEMYDGKAVTLNGDHAKVRDAEGVAEIKSETNSVTMPWSKVHEVMTKKSGNFRAEKKEEEKKKEKEVNEALTQKEMDKAYKMPESVSDSAHGKAVNEEGHHGYAATSMGAMDFLEYYVLRTFGNDEDYNLDADTANDGSKIAFVEVYTDRYDEIAKALESDYEKATLDFKAAVENTGVFTNPRVSTGDDFISYQVTYQESFRR